MSRKNFLLASLIVLFTVLSGLISPKLAAQPTPFQTTVAINIDNFNFTPVPIPTGYRLLVQYVSLSGATQTSGAYVQPIIILGSNVNGGPQTLYYFVPPESTAVPGQYYMSQPTAIYADSLVASPAFAGFTPTFMSFNFVISGVLEKIPPK